MSTSQTAVMLCGWGVTAGRLWLVCMQNCVLPYLSALENAIGILKRFTNVQVYFTFFTFIPLAPMLLEGQYNVHIRLQLASDKTEPFGVQPKRI